VDDLEMVYLHLSENITDYIPYFTQNYLYTEQSISSRLTVYNFSRI